MIVRHLRMGGKGEDHSQTQNELIHGPVRYICLADLKGSVFGTELQTVQ